MLYSIENVLVGDCQRGKPTVDEERSSSDAASEPCDSVQDDPRWRAHGGETGQAVRPVSQKRHTGVH